MDVSVETSSTPPSNSSRQTSVRSGAKHGWSPASASAHVVCGFFVFQQITHQTSRSTTPETARIYFQSATARFHHDLRGRVTNDMIVSSATYFAFRTSTGSPRKLALADRGMRVPLIAAPVADDRHPRIVSR